MNTYPCVITSIPVDYERTKIHFNRFFDLLPISEIIFIGPENLRNNISSDIAAGLFNNNKLCFICEDEFLPFDSIKKIYEELLAKSSVTNPSSVNWYYQQFLKMAYSAICTTDYYLCWDSDTLPLKKIELFNAAGKPYLDVKAENNSSYFSTIEKLFGYGKIIDKSFISEHMFFNKKLMSELITMIENSSFDGIHFFEKILNAVGSDNLALGFSEFETYGTFIGMNYPSAYILRNWKSFRNLNFYIDIHDINDDDIQWLSIDYDAATFEKYQETEPLLTQLFRNKRYREKLSPEQFYISVLESGAMGDYSNGRIRVGNNYYPI